MGTHALSNNISPQTLCQQSFVAICHCQTSCNCALPLIAATVRSDCTVHLASVKGLESSTHKPILPTQSANMSKEYTYADVSSHSGKKDLLMVIHDKVYDTTAFVDEHPKFPPHLVLLLHQAITLVWASVSMLLFSSVLVLHMESSSTQRAKKERHRGDGWIWS